MNNCRHQYIERYTGRVRDEKPYGDRMVNLLYSGRRESPHLLLKALTGPWLTDFLGFIHYDIAVGGGLTGASRFVAESGIDMSECVEGPEAFKSLRDVFERKIRYWECRPMPEDQYVVTAPADSRMIVGSLAETSRLFLKGKFFDFEEFLGKEHTSWLKDFENGDFAVFRLTPDKYHYNHTPVAGKVLDIYEIEGAYHSCNPGAVVTVATPYSKNKRVVTIIDTDVPGGSRVGTVAMVEVVALMIGEIVQCYSDRRYDAPRPVRRGMFLEKGRPKSLYRPGSSTDVLIFRKGRIRFADDIVRNMHRPGIESRFSLGFGKSLVETEVQVRSPIAHSIAQ